MSRRNDWPGNNRPVDWPDFRRHLLETPYPANMERVFDVLNRLSAAGSATSYDEEARSCLMGVPAAFFYLTRFTLETMDRDEYGRPEDADVVRKATLQYSVFENYISALHPGLINAGNWSFNDEQVFVLRKQILGAYRQLEAKKKLEPKWPFKVYVYDEEEVPQLQPLLRSQIYCSRGQWGTDVQVHDYFVTADFQTDDPKEADFFFVPGYAICVLEGNLYTLDEVDELYKELVPALPYFNASGGRDHIFVFGSGMAQSVFQSWEEYIPQSIVLTPETELFNDFAWVAIPPYRPFKDIVIPGSLDLIEVIAALEKSKPLRERRFLTAFFGRADLVRGPHPWVGGVDVRKELIALKDLPGTEDMKFGDGATLQVMHEAYGDAKFCFVPRGKSGWSLRFFEVIFAGCVPVMISDKWELPFEDFLDVTRFVIKWPSTQIGPQSEGRQLQAERQQARGLAQENQRLKKSLHDSEASVQSLRTQNLELEKEQRAWQKAEEESRKAAAILRQEVEKLREERQDLDRQVSNQERQSRRHHSRTSTLQPRPPDSGSSAHRSTVMEVDLRTEGKPQMEEKELEDSSSGSSNEYYEQEPPAHIKQRLASLQQAAPQHPFR